MCCTLGNLQQFDLSDLLALLHLPDPELRSHQSDLPDLEALQDPVLQWHLPVRQDLELPLGLVGLLRQLHQWLQSILEHLVRLEDLLGLSDLQLHQLPLGLLARLHQLLLLDLLDLEPLLDRSDRPLLLHLLVLVHLLDLVDLALLLGLVLL